MNADRRMSRTPLLLRSSPAAGTGSSGVLPNYHTDYDEHDFGDVAPHRRARSLRPQAKGKRRLRRVVTEGEDGVDPTHNSVGISEQFQEENPWLSSSPDAHISRLGRETQLGSRARRMSDTQGRSTSQRIKSYREEVHKVRKVRSLMFQDVPAYNTDASESEVDEDDASSAISNASSDDDSSSSSPDDSQYPQVRASVPPTDNINLSINTPRMWTLSILFAIFGSSTNLFFSLRYPSVSITPVIALLIVHPLGLLWDRILKRSHDPIAVFTNGSFSAYMEDDVMDDGHGVLDRTLADRTGSATRKLEGNTWRRWRLWLSRGQWNEKEHCCVYISSNVSFGFAFATDVIVEQSQFYKQETPLLYQILLTLSTQILGYAMAGLTRQFLVRPGGMIWPSTLVSSSLFTSLHKEKNEPANGWHISRFRFFLYVFAGSAIFYFLPGLLFPALSWFNVITWFAPQSVVVANLFGVASGLGMFPMTFDWSQIAYIGSPLVVPFWAALNIIGGLVIVMWIIAPIMYYTNTLYSAYMPILSSTVFDNTGKPYNVSRILALDFTFDQTAYESYSRVFLPITYVLSYALQFAALTALITHTACWHGADIWRHWRHSMQEIRAGEKLYEPLSIHDGSTGRAGSSSRLLSPDFEPGLDNIMAAEDVHNRLMRRYEDVPMQWYLLTGIAMTAIGIFVVEYFPVHLPWYGLLLALAICAVLYIPIGIVMATTNQQASLYLICQLICGYIWPGRPVANMVFVTYGYITSTQGLKFSSDLKLGHYLKIPPKLLFTVQVAATVVASLTQIVVLNWMLVSVPGICTPEAINGFTCPLARVHFNGSVLWGVVGPNRFFGPKALYRPLVWAFLFGAIAPIISYALYRYLSIREIRHKRELHHSSSSPDHRQARKKRSVPSSSLLQKLNFPVLFGSLSWIPPATGLNFSVWFLVCYLFNQSLRKRYTAWWSKYTMVLSAALDSGLAVGVVVVFFGVIYPGLLKGWSWWGTEVYKLGCDWTACSWLGLEDGQTFGPKRW